MKDPFKPTGDEFLLMLGHDVIGGVDQKRDTLTPPTPPSSAAAVVTPRAAAGPRPPVPPKTKSSAAATPRAVAWAPPCAPPRSAAEVEFDVAHPPATPVEPPGTAPVDDDTAMLNDVRCGRGPGTNRLEGNRRFRALVRDFQPTYLVARRSAKPRLARSVVLIVRRRGGRFLRRNDSDGGFYELGDEKAEAKTLQALREGLDVRATKRAATRVKGAAGGTKVAAGGMKVVAGGMKGAAEPGRGKVPGGHGGHAAITPSPGGKRRPVSPIVNPDEFFPGDIQETQRHLVLDSGSSSMSSMQVQGGPGQVQSGLTEPPSVPLLPTIASTNALTQKLTEEGMKREPQQRKRQKIPPSFEAVVEEAVAEAQPWPVAAAPATPAAARHSHKPKPPPSCKRCNHEACTKYKQTGCHGFCSKHAKVHYPGLSADGVPSGKRKKKVKAQAAPPALPEAMAVAEAPTSHEACPVEEAPTPAAALEPIDPTLAAMVAAAAQDPSLWKSPTFAAAMTAVVQQTTARSLAK